MYGVACMYQHFITFHWKIIFHWRNVSHFIHSSAGDICVVSAFWLLQIVTRWASAHMFCMAVCFVSLGVYLRGELLGNVWPLKTCQAFPKWLSHFTFPPAVCGGSKVIHLSTLTISLLDYSYASGHIYIFKVILFFWL